MIEDYPFYAVGDACLWPGRWRRGCGRPMSRQYRFPDEEEERWRFKVGIGTMVEVEAANHAEAMEKAREKVEDMGRIFYLG